MTGGYFDLSDEERIRRIRELVSPEESRGRDRLPVVLAVGRYLLVHPDASANAVAAAVPFRRADVLWAVSELRRAPGPVPEPGYRQPGEEVGS